LIQVRPNRKLETKCDFISVQSTGSCFRFGGRALCAMNFAPNVLKSVKLARRKARARATLAARVGIAASMPRPPHRPKPAPLTKHKPAA
jgi:hypothetical protein